MIKKEAIQLRMKKIECNLHGNPIKYQCDFPHCPSPYLCSDIQCIEQHFHDDQKVILGKFNSTMWESKLQQAENVINNNLLKEKEDYLTKVIRYFTSSLHKIKEEAKQFEQMKFRFYEDEGQLLNGRYLNDVNGFLSLGSKLQRKIDKLRSRINDEQISFQDSSEIVCLGARQEQQRQYPSEAPQRYTIQANGGAELQANSNQYRINQNQEPSSHKRFEQGSNREESVNMNFKIRKEVEYYEDPALTKFLESYIEGFSWAKTRLLFNIQSPLTTCEKFHEKLKDKSHLLFLFVGDSLILGSFYETGYPSVAERSKKDDHSFIFIQDDSLAEGFALFVADKDSDFHISVSQKLLICQGNTPNNGDGLRTFQRNFQSLAYYLPSRSFRDAIEGRDVNYNGVLKIKQFYILQLTRD